MQECPAGGEVKMYRFAAMAAMLLLVGSCATSDKADERDDITCKGYGAQVGTKEYVECRTALAHQRAAEAQARAAHFRQAMRAIGSDLQGPPQGPEAETRIGGGGVSTTCHRRGEARSGMNKICYYDCLGSAAATTVGSAELCPLTIEH
jgi:hypothetical protein